MSTWAISLQVWDYMAQSHIHTYEDHGDYVFSVNLHRNMPILISGSHDGSFQLWNRESNRLYKNSNYGKGRLWSVTTVENSNMIILGFDKGDDDTGFVTFHH